MFRATLQMQGINGGTTEDRLESLKRQFNPEEGFDGTNTNGLAMNLQDQYDQQEAEQQHAAKRQRGMGMHGGADFGAFGTDRMGVAMNGGMGMGMGMGNAGPNVNSMGNHGAGMNMNGNPMGAGTGGGGGGGMNGMMSAGGAGAGGGMNSMGAGGSGMNGMNMNMNGAMNGAMNMNMNGAMNGAMNMNMNMNGAMNGAMNMAAARAGMLGPMGGAGGAGASSGFSHLNSQGMPSSFSSAMENDIAAAFYLNNFEGSGAGMGSLLGQRGGGLGFMAQGGSLGGFLPSGAGAGGAFGGYGRMSNPYDGLGAAGFSQGTGGTAGSAAANAAAMGGVGLPSSNARRAQLIALMDMESELQQQEAAKVGSSAFPGAPGGSGPGQNSDLMAVQRANGLVSPGGLGGVSALAGAPIARRGDDCDGLNMGHPTALQMPEPPMELPTFSTASTPAILPLPPVIEEGAAAHYSQRAHIPLGIDEDNNWLTEFQCFIRFDLIEVVQASRHVDQVNAGSGKNSNNSGGETFQQVGVRCRYCAHLHPGQRASRSSAFPSSIRQLYQSFTMMLRDHFEQCSEIPPLRKKLFSELKSKNSQGAYDSKQYWIYAAEKLGMIDSEHGIQMTAESQAKARRKPPFGTVGETPHTHSPPKLLVTPEDIRITSDFLYTLMSQVQVVHLIDSERVGKRKTLRVGLPGFGCRYCCHVGRCGLSRMFPLRRRMLPGKVNEIYEHVKRCTLFPTKEKDLLARLKAEDKTGPEQEKEFFDRIWERLGCESEVKK